MLDTLLSAQGFIPHGHCYLWKPGLIWLHILSDGLIALAYFSIPILLGYFVFKRRDVPFHQIFLLFGLFIISCGSGHVMDIWTLWYPTYWLAGVMKAMTAIISVYTAFSLIPLIPQALSLPSPEQLEQANRELESALLSLQQTQAQLVHTEKMSSLGQLVAGIAHEINNPINFIHGNLSYAGVYTEDLLEALRLYRDNYPQPAAPIQRFAEERDLDFIAEDFPKILTSMRIGAERICQIVLSLRNFSRLDESEVKPVDIHEGIDSTLLILQHQLKAAAGRAAVLVEKEYSQLPLVECYAGQLNQVFMNLLSNAIDALEHQRQQNESKNAETREAAQIKISTELMSQHWIQIKISDNGSGMSEVTQKRLFSPFFTTKPAGRGTGLGLSISQRIVVEKHGGKLECISQLNQGTTFLVTIPVRQSLAKSQHYDVATSSMDFVPAQ
jgi:signal transduction histidine kinase